MRWRSFALLVAIASLPLALAAKAGAMTAEEADCCATIAQQTVSKYYSKHIKIVTKCTSRMDASSDPASEKCDDGFDPFIGGTDFVIDKFGPKFFKKIKKKCEKALGITITPTTPAISGCGCPTETFLEDQINCAIAKMAAPADCQVCDITPTLKNANRSNQSPPNTSTYCQSSCSP